MKTGSIITDTISVTFAHVQGNIESDESFDFVVSLLQIYLHKYQENI